MVRSAQVAGGALAAGTIGSLPSQSFADAPLAHLSASPPDLPPPPLSNADYWRFADWLAGYFDQLWDGDSAYYRSDTTHSFRNTGEGVARFFGITAPPNL